MIGLLGRVPEAMAAWWRALRHRPRRELAMILLPWASLLVGLALAVASFLPSTIFLETARIGGHVGPFGSNATLFPYSGYNYAEITFEERPSCAIRLFVLDSRRADEYNATSTLPPPSDSLHCDRIRGGFRGSIALFVVSNRFNGTENYTARVDLFSVSQPYLLLSIPAVVLLPFGALTIAVRRFRVGLERLAGEDSDRISRRKEKR